MTNNKVSFEHMQFLVEVALNKLFDEDKDKHGWSFDDYSKASVEYAMMSSNNLQELEMDERYMN